jgi:nanoRNase/pAp phosphatase (c-di-AMP/oligoRNAs hydrolase)
MVTTLRAPLVPVEELIPGFQGAVILVDTQPGQKNNCLPVDIEPLAVIDHHPNWGNTDSVSFLDLRETYGATSTILTSYLQEIEAPIDAALATVLFYGISAETQHLGRETIPADIQASQFLYPYIDKRLLGSIENPPLTRDYYQLINRATEAAVLYGDVVAVVLESVPFPDAVAEVADFLLRLESASWTFCLAPFDEWVYVSVRTKQSEARAGILLATLLPEGRAGGHGMIAGGLFRKREGDWKADASELLEAFLRAVGCGESEEESLVLSTTVEV